MRCIVCACSESCKLRRSITYDITFVLAAGTQSAQIRSLITLGRLAQASAFWGTVRKDACEACFGVTDALLAHYIQASDEGRYHLLQSPTRNPIHRGEGTNSLQKQARLQVPAIVLPWKVVSVIANSGRHIASVASAEILALRGTEDLLRLRLSLGVSVPAGPLKLVDYHF